MIETSLTTVMWKVPKDPREVYTIVEDARSIHTCAKECGRMRKSLEDHGMWENNLESSMIVLYLHVQSKTF